MADVNLIPNAAGDLTECSRFGTGDYNYEYVDDPIGIPDDTNGVSAYGNSVTNTDLYNVPNQVLTGTITNVVIYCRCAKYSEEYSCWAKTAVKTGGTIYYGTESELGTSFAVINTSYATNPKTGLAWTWSEIDALQIGVQLYDEYVSEADCSQCYAVVTYTAASIPVPVFMSQFRRRR